MIRRLPIVLLLAATWFSAVLHADLEAIGWMVEHEHHHHHAHEEETPADARPHFHGDHDPIYVRDLSPDVRVGAPLLLLVAMLPVLGLLASLIIKGPIAVESRVVPRRREERRPLPWQFLWRCAPDSAAPPALS